MILRLLATWLTTVLFVAGTLGCSKKQPDPTPEKNTGSYLLSGIPKICQVTASVITGAGQDNLVIDLTTTPQPASGPEVLSLEFIKPTTQPTSAYKFNAVFLFRNNRLNTQFPDAVATLTILNNGNLSGTFSAAGYDIHCLCQVADLKQGVLTNVQI